MNIRSRFQKFDQYKELIFGYSSFIGLIFTIAFTITAIFYQDWDITFNFVLITIAFINALIAISAIYSIRMFHLLSREFNATKDKNIDIESQYEENIEKLKTEIEEKDLIISVEIYKQKIIATTIHNILHESRKIINKIATEQNFLYNPPLSENIESLNIDLLKSNFKNLEKSFQLFMLYVLDNIKTTYDILSEDECSVCIKMILVGKNKKNIEVTGDNNLRDVYIRTYMRDSFSYRQRNFIDERVPTFPYHENTAFQLILEKRYPDSFFLSNNLEKFEKGYRNYRDDWNNFYNACIVVPIRIQIKNGGYIVIGFICIDNIKGGFDSAGKDLLAAIGDHLFHVFRAFSDLNEVMKAIVHEKNVPKSP